jgi:hypothetical protein
MYAAHWNCRAVERAEAGGRRLDAFSVPLAGRRNVTADP